MIHYIEASAAAKLLVDELQRADWPARLDSAVDQHHPLLSSMLLAAALRVGADVMVTYDRRQADAAA